MNNLSESKNSVEKHPDSEAILKKFWICNFVTQEMFGSQNTYRALEMTWTVLYDMENIDRLEISTSPVFPTRMEDLNKPVNLRNIKVPNKEDFVNKLRRILTREIDYDQAVTPEVKEQLYQLIKRGPVRIWTEGDTKGIKNEEYNFPGSHGQIFKISRAGFNNLRKRYALENSNKESKIDYHDALSVLATEGKINAVTKIVEEFLDKKINNIVLVEDRLKNIEKATEKIEKWLILKGITDVNLSTVLISKKEIENTKPVTIGEGKFYKIKEFTQLEKIIKQDESLNINFIGSIIDYDGVLSNDKIRQKVVGEKLIEFLSEKHWI